MVAATPGPCPDGDVGQYGEEYSRGTLAATQEQEAYLTMPAELPGASCMPVKTHWTAVAVIPPHHVWEPIQAIRHRYDRHIHRWMPHVNLLYPFVPTPQFSTVLPQLEAAAGQIPAFEVTLESLRVFTHASRRSTLWLAPQPQEALVRLQRTLQMAFPAFDEQSRFAQGFTPHLSVGQATASAAHHLAATLQAEWQPLRFRLDAIALIWRTADTPFAVAHWLPLASSS
jgi:2'-5' RNA ligase